MRQNGKLIGAQPRSLVMVEGERYGCLVFLESFGRDDKHLVPMRLWSHMREDNVACQVRKHAKLWMHAGEGA
jgi:hypothetical protein